MGTPLIVDRKTGFNAITDVEILDVLNRDFYKCNAGTSFNMPKGKFTCYGRISKLSEPLNYSLAFHAFERDDRNFNNIIIKFCKNPHKASVVFSNNTANIFIDNSIAKMPLVCQMYVVNHELAHAYYIGEDAKDLEMLCDEYAEHQLIERGINPSQIKACNNKLLKAGWRKESCNDRMIKNFSK